MIGSLGSFYRPFFNKPTDYSPQKIDYWQTSGSALSTAGSVKIIGSATAESQYFINSLHITYQTPGANSYAVVRVAGTAASVEIGVVPTNSTMYNLNYNFGPIGLNCGATPDTTTSTVTCEVVVITTTATVSFVANGYKII